MPEANESTQSQHLRLTRRARRERMARKEAEQVLERKSLELYEANQRLRQSHDQLEQRVAERTSELRRSLGQLREQIARRERVERELTKLSLVASKTDNAVIITDARGRIEWVNEGFTRITEYPAEEALGRKPGDLLQGPDTDPRTVGAIRERLRRGEGFRGEIVNYSRSGRAYWLALDIQPVREEDGRITRFIAIESEITERKEAEAAMRRARDQAEAANRAKSEFLANMSHEIRTPLNAIIGFADLLHREDPAPDPRAAPQRREWIDTIRGSGEHLLGLINDVLDLSKIEAGRMEVERIACSPFEIISHVASTLRVRAAEKDLRLRIEYADRLPETIVSDPTRLRQILMNLTGNAIKFTERGEVVLRTRLEESAEAPPRLAIDVIDQGVGIAPEKLEAIFQPFTQADSSTTRRFGGTGLGLTISRRMAEAMGGGLSIRSEEGAGSTFTARVETGPLDPAKMIEGPTSETMRGERREAAPAKKTSDRLGGRVLVVEDGEVNRKLITILLRKAGLVVETAEHGGVGVERALAEPFDLILMDMQMPVMDGYTAAARLRERGVSVPIVALTAHAMKEDREKCLAAGCSGYLSKPIDRDELMRTLAEVLSPADAEPAPEGPTGRIARGADGAGRAEARELVPLRSTIATDEPDLLEVVEQFVEELPDRLQRMREAMREHDLRRLAELAHALKGSGGTVGLEAFTDPAARLERLALDERLDQLAETMDELRDLAARAEAGLRPCVGS